MLHGAKLLVKLVEISEHAEKCRDCLENGDFFDLEKIAGFAKRAFQTRCAASQQRVFRKIANI